MVVPLKESGTTFVCAWFCPFAQRTWIAVNEKALPHTYFEISREDLYGKPDWFLDLNPAGLIPVLAYKEGGKRRVVSESLICNEFLEDYQPNPPLLPKSAYEKAQARAIIVRFDTKFVKQWFRYLMQQDPQVQVEAAQQIDVELKWLSSLLDASGGPYFLGSDFSLVDCALVPLLLRIFILERFRGYKIPTECGSLVKYIDKATSRECVTNTMIGPNGQDYKEALLQFFAPYADGSARSMMAREAMK